MPATPLQPPCRPAPSARGLRRLGAALLLSCSAAAWAAEARLPRLDLSPQEIERAVLSGNDLEIRLKPEGARRLQEATTTYQGQKLELYLQDEFVVGAVPRNPVSTGVVLAPYPSQNLRRIVAPFLNTAAPQRD